MVVLSRVFFSMLMLFSTVSFATGNEDAVVLEGNKFSLKRSEVQNFLQTAYGLEVSEIRITKAFATYFSLLEGYSDYFREVRFRMSKNGKPHEISCLLHVNANENFIRTTKCSAEPSAAVDPISKRKLSDYSKVDSFVVK